LVILQTKVLGLSEEALDRFVLRARRAAGLRGTVNVLVTGSPAVRALNREFRGQNKATDVLSFPLALATPVRRQRGVLAGEIAISADIAVQNAARLGHPPAQEIKVLTLHGILHLAGFDHERDNGQMALKEAKLRQALGLPAALIERSQPARRESSKPRRLKAHGAGARRTA
jgi:probable rRNA maturation factor